MSGFINRDYSKMATFKGILDVDAASRLISKRTRLQNGLETLQWCGYAIYYGCGGCLLDSISILVNAQAVIFFTMFRSLSFPHQDIVKRIWQNVSFHIKEKLFENNLPTGGWLTRSRNTMNLMTADLYTSVVSTDILKKIVGGYVIKKQFDTFPIEGVCKGSSAWFSALYLNIQKNNSLSSRDCIKQVGKIFENGAPHAAILLQDIQCSFIPNLISLPFSFTTQLLYQAPIQVFAIACMVIEISILPIKTCAFLFKSTIAKKKFSFLEKSHCLLLLKFLDFKVNEVIKEYFFHSTSPYRLIENSMTHGVLNLKVTDVRTVYVRSILKIENKADNDPTLCNLSKGCYQILMHNAGKTGHETVYVNDGAIGYLFDQNKGIIEFRGKDPHIQLMQHFDKLYGRTYDRFSFCKVENYHPLQTVFALIRFTTHSIVQCFRIALLAHYRIFS